MASIIDQHGTTLTSGVPQEKCVEMAKKMAKERDEIVTLCDDEGDFEVSPDGTVRGDLNS